MDHRETFLGTVGALADFIRANATYPLPSDYRDGEWAADTRYVVESIGNLASGQDRDASDRFWPLKATALEMFLRKAPELGPVFRPISSTANDVSRDAPFDPLTYRGLGDVLHFINNGLLDDAWVALYRSTDGERRAVGEAIDDANMLRKPLQSLKNIGHFDKSEDWLMGAERRDKLSHENFEKVFADDLLNVVPRVPLQSELMNLWTSRPYSDFMPRQTP
jgi:hypothetical protein